MGIFKNRITIEDKDFLEKYLRGCEHGTSGLSYTSLYMWRNVSDVSWELIGDYLCIAGWAGGEDVATSQMMFAPLSCSGSFDSKALRETIYEARRRFEEGGCDFQLMLVPEGLKEELEKACPGELTFSEDRDNFDYVYEISDLVSLSGREHHAKKNHLNYFKSHYEYTYEELKPEQSDEILEFVQKFNEHKDVDPEEKDMLEMEKSTMRDVFGHMQEVGYFGGVIRIDGQIEAFCVGGALDDSVVVEHIEKANRDYRGLYQLINNEFAKDISSRFRYMNREEDMGLENLRKAKLSLKPAYLVKKYSAMLQK